jgi:hypothetical protein
MNIPLTSFTLFDGTPLGKYTDRAPGFDGGALRWDNARAQPAIVTMVSAILNNAQFGDVLTRIQLAAIRIGGSDSPSFDVTLRTMVTGHVCPGDPIEFTSRLLTAAGFQVIEMSSLLPTDKGTVCYELSIQPTPGTLINDDVALLAIELDHAS